MCRTRLLCGYICCSGEMVVSWSAWAYNMRVSGKHERQPEENMDSVRARDNYTSYFYFSSTSLYISVPCYRFFSS